MVEVFDTTLRDGEQMPEVFFEPEQKIALAEKLDSFGVDVIEVMAAVSEDEKRVAKELASLELNADIRGLCRIRKEEIELAAECGVDRVLVFTSLSDLHIEKKLRTTREANLAKSLEMKDLALQHGLKVDFGGEDATRADMDYVIEFINSFKGIECFLPADTIGALNPRTAYTFFSKIVNECKPKIEIHCHNDFGLAVANTLAGVEAGAHCFSGTFGGIGERSGNASIEEVCLALKFFYDSEVDWDFSLVGEICSLIQDYSGQKFSPLKPWIGDNAFVHESGIHGDGIVKDPRLYEHFDPSFLGRKRKLLFGKHSGSGMIRGHLKKHGIEVSEKELAEFLATLKAKKKYFSEKEVVERWKGC